MTTVMGRVRATVCLKAGEAGSPRVIVTSWASDRSFPRTVGAGVPFDLEASDGQVYRIDPFDAFVTLPVRASDSRDGVRREEGWIAAHDEITVEGELESVGRSRRPPALRARRIAMGGTPALHRLPPRALQRGEPETIRVEVDARSVVSKGVESSAPAMLELTAPASEAPAMATPGPPTVETTPEPDDAALVPRRPKKKRPDSSGTPTPIQ